MKPIIVIPAYNEVGTVARVVEGARVWAPVIVVDDGSTDGTADAAAAAGAEVISHRRRLGKGQAIRTGVAAVRARGGSVMVTLDADGQHDPADVPSVLAALRRTPRSIAIASRRRDADALPPARRNALRVAAFFVDWTADLSVRDTQSGFRGYPVAVFDELTLTRGGFVLETEVLLAAAAADWSIIELDVRAIPRAGRRSRFRPLLDGAAIVTFVGRHVIARWGAELRAAARELRGLVHRDRRRARHAAMLESAAPYTDFFGAWSLAIGIAAFRRLGARGKTWWTHPRRRRAALAARASAVTPLVLGLAAVQWLGGRWVPDLVTPLVDGMFAPESLDGVVPSDESADLGRELSIGDDQLTPRPATRP
jgi:glycosyltransferase involved in cell wall biosynthesis